MTRPRPSSAPESRPERSPDAPRLLGAVLAGGASRRFGSDKAAARLGGRTFLDRALDALAPSVARRAVVFGSDGEDGAARARAAAPGGSRTDVDVLRDDVPDRGPLEGLRVALEWAAREGADGVVVLSCDVPLVDDATVAALVRAFAARPPSAPHGVVPVAAGRDQPLVAVWSVDALSAVARRAGEEDRSLRGLAEALSVHRVPAEALAPAGSVPGAVGGRPGHGRIAPADVFLNVNTPADRDRVRALLDGVPDALPPVVCVVGWKNSGKTGTVVALAAELVRRGRRVMTAKHGHGFDLDTEGTDSWRHRHEGGAHRVALVGPEAVALTGGWGPEGEPPLAEVVRRYLSDAEIVVAEGWKGGPEPKIEVHRTETGQAPLCGGGDAAARGFLALATNGTGFEPGIPVFDLDDPALAARLAELVEARLLPDGAS